MSKNQWGILAVALLVLCIAGASKHPFWSAYTQAGMQKLRFARAFRSPISFYGRLLDQKGHPVAGARVELQPNDKAWSAGSTHIRSSDSHGDFAISGISGLSLYVNVSKPGYYRVHSRGGKIGSDGGFDYGNDLGRGIHSPDPAAPVIFVLQKAGDLEPMVKMAERDFLLNKNGDPIQIDLEGGKGTHLLSVQCYTQQTEDRYYDWKFVVTVPKGKLALRDGEFAFEAPLAGYNTSFEYTMSKSLPPTEWKSSVERSFFVRFEDDVYARVDVEMRTGGSHFVVVKGYLNPKRGSRNLEAPPKRR